MSKTQHGVPEGSATLEKSGTQVKVTGAYTRRQLRDMLMGSSLSLMPILDDEKVEEVLRHTSITKEDLQKLRKGEQVGDATRIWLKDLGITREMVAAFAGKSKDPEEELVNFLRSKGISEDLKNRILKYGLTDEIIRLLKALGLTDEEMAMLFGMWKGPPSESVESCPSIPSSSDEYMTLESLYLKSSFRKPLANALHEMVAKKPYDAVEYLGHWLLNFKVCEERAKRQREFDEELMAERERLKMLEGESKGSEIFEFGEEEQLQEDWNFMEYEGV